MPLTAGQLYGTLLVEFWVKKVSSGLLIVGA